MKQIYVQPQIKVRHFVAHNILAGSDPTVHTGDSATEGGKALSKEGSDFNWSSPDADQEGE